jgi:hypothetical protein
VHHSGCGNLTGLELGQFTHRHQYLLPFLQQVIDGMGLSGSSIFFSRNSLGYLGYFIYL